MTTSIEWTDATWNPVTGCDRISPGCAHCYALTLAKRLKAMGHPAYQQDGGPASGPGFAVQLHPDRLDHPLRWKKPRRIFVNSMSDLFHPNVPEEFIDSVFGVMTATPHHQYQVLTKRPKRMLEYLSEGSRVITVDCAFLRIIGRPATGTEGVVEWPLPNVWLGVSVENQRMADERIPLLLQTPAAVRFLSVEPMLGPIDLWRRTYHDEDCPTCEASGSVEPYDGSPGGAQCPKCEGGGQIHTEIDWIICGGESGPAHRFFDPAWAEELAFFAKTEKIPFFMKQLGGARPGTKLEDLPEDLRIREFPR